MSTQAELSVRRDKVLEKLESLQSRITQGDRTVEYDLRFAQKALDSIEKEIARSGKITRQLRVRSDKGL